MNKNTNLKIEINLSVVGTNKGDEMIDKKKAIKKLLLAALYFGKFFFG